MNIVSRFHPLPDADRPVNITVDGEALVVPEGISLAAALLAHSGDANRQTETGEARTAYCMMGACFDCLVEVDGTPNTQACMTLVRDGMVVRRQSGRRGFGGAGDA